MKTNKSAKLIIAGLIGCGICCLPLLLPIAAGMTGASILGFTFGQIVCGVLFLVVGIMLLGLYRSKKKNSCSIPASEKDH